MVHLPRLLTVDLHPTQLMRYICSCSGGQRRVGCEVKHKCMANIISDSHCVPLLISCQVPLSIDIREWWIKTINPPVEPVSIGRSTGEGHCFSMTGIGFLGSESWKACSLTNSTIRASVSCMCVCVCVCVFAAYTPFSDLVSINTTTARMIFHITIKFTTICRPGSLIPCNTKNIYLNWCHLYFLKMCLYFCLV